MVKWIEFSINNNRTVYRNGKLWIDEYNSSDILISFNYGTGYLMINGVDIIVNGKPVMNLNKYRDNGDIFDYFPDEDYNNEVVHCCEKFRNIMIKKVKLPGSVLPLRAINYNRAIHEEIIKYGYTCCEWTTQDSIKPAKI